MAHWFAICSCMIYLSLFEGKGANGALAFTLNARFMFGWTGVIRSYYTLPDCVPEYDDPFWQLRCLAEDGIGDLIRETGYTSEVTG